MLSKTYHGGNPIHDLVLSFCGGVLLATELKMEVELLIKPECICPHFKMYTLVQIEISTFQN